MGFIRNALRVSSTRARSFNPGIVVATSLSCTSAESSRDMKVVALRVSCMVAASYSMNVTGAL